MNERKKCCLSGNDWFFKLDPRDEGIRKEWFLDNKRFSDKICVPGAWQAQGFGGKGTNIMYQIPLEPQQVERWAYKGTGWYKKSFVVPKDWQGKTVWLKFGAVHPKAEVWVNEERLGTDDGGLVSFKFDISRIVCYGEENTVTVRVYEHGRDYYYAELGGIINYPSTWSGLYRDVYLEATENIWIERMIILPDIKHKQAPVTLHIENRSSLNSNEARLRISAQSPRTRDTSTIEKTIQLKPGSQVEELVLKIKDPFLWSPDDPHVYTVRCELVLDGKAMDVVEDRFGMRNFDVTDTQILLNGKPIYLRGYAFHLPYPLTLAPTTDKKYLRKMLLLGKSYGFNKVHVYGYPHPEYMEVCDEVGMLLQVFPRTLGDPRRQVNAEHMKNLILQHINHPSIMVYGFGSELYSHAPDLTKLFDRLYNETKAMDPTRLIVARDGSRLHTIGYGKSDYEIIGLGSGSREGVVYFNPKMVQPYKRPFVVHEFAWWSSYPDSSLKKKYTGGMLPYFITYAEKKAKKNGLQKLLPIFVENSQNLQAIERKVCLEAIRTVPNINGFDLWMGHDTCCGIQGLWDDFGGAKNVSAKEFLKTNGDTVLLMEQDFSRREGWVDKRYCQWVTRAWHFQPGNFDRDDDDTPWIVNPAFQGRTLWDGETLDTRLLISHFGPTAINKATLTWQLCFASSGRRIRSGQKVIKKVPSASPKSMAQCSVKIPQLKRAEKLVLTAKLTWDNHTVTNEWNFWAFPRVHSWNPDNSVRLAGSSPMAEQFSFIRPWNSQQETPDLLLSSVLNEEVIRYLEGGGRVLLLSEDLLPECHSSFHSIPWGGRSWGNSGTVIDKKHPALKNFPHEGFCDLQFYDLVNIRRQCPPRTGVINLDVWPRRIDPIIRSIDSYMGAKSRGYLLEARIGKGRLLVSRLDFSKVTPASMFLFAELVRYSHGGEFQPKVNISPSFLRTYAGDGPEFSQRISEGLCSWEPTTVVNPCHPPVYARDNDMATYCRLSGPGPFDFGMAFRQPRTINHVSVVFLCEVDVCNRTTFSQPTPKGYPVQYWVDGEWKTIDAPKLTKRDFTRPDVVLALTDQVGDESRDESEGTWQWDFQFPPVRTQRVRILMTDLVKSGSELAIVYFSVH